MGSSLLFHIIKGNLYNLYSFKMYIFEKNYVLQKAHASFYILSVNQNRFSTEKYVPNQWCCLQTYRFQNNEEPENKL